MGDRLGRNAERTKRGLIGKRGAVGRDLTRVRGQNGRRHPLQTDQVGEIARARDVKDIVSLLAKDLAELPDVM